MTLNSLSTKHHKTAPLPFTGQKRMFLRHFEKILKDNIPNDGEGFTVLDVFGGSGLLAHNAKRILPKATVIYNDFDGYVERLAHIPTTNRLRQELFEILKGEPRSVKLSSTAKAKVLGHLRKSADNGTFVDVQTLAGWLLFSGRQVGSLDEFLAESTFYNRIVKTDYPNADGYLDGLILECLDFEKLLQKYQDTPNCLLLLDPPYLCTAQGAYAKHGYFGMTKFLRLMQFVRPPFIFFSSTKSELMDYMAYVQRYEPNTWQRVGDFTHIKVNSSINAKVSYEDNILAKF
ncbi:Site-specific DNA methylase [Moraxella caprae]|uniref:Site-specific DNA methylase n=1 Tax=Moraxella caprae TaxID=90240 RepID=A0A378R607_9GAMM|nr:DNA adenine methylase [Moraxella caprae]STZ09340.1 Site-specific DNA methylase [Moraxella caprae]